MRTNGLSLQEGAPEVLTVVVKGSSEHTRWAGVLRGDTERPRANDEYATIWVCFSGLRWR